MLVSMGRLIRAAYQGRYAVGAFNIYNLEGALAVVRASEESNAPSIIQIHSAGINFGGKPLMALSLRAAQSATVPIAVHLDHNSDEVEIREALENGITSIMADGSRLPYEENIAFTQKISDLVHRRNGTVEAELGRLAGTEDGLSIPEIEARMTDPWQAAEFVERTNIDALAVCIGNIHGHYWQEPKLDFLRLEEINKTVSLPLVLHGASGLPAIQVRQAIQLGISKVNVNTEIREAYTKAVGAAYMGQDKSPELLKIMNEGVNAMVDVIKQKIDFFGSAGKTPV
jgi:tagatose 1,6-diphosphate aldolase GatY/KbaY